MDKRIRRRRKRYPLAQWLLVSGMVIALALCLGWGVFFAALEPADGACASTAPQIQPPVAPPSETPAPEPPWNLTLVNFRNPIPEDYSVPLIQLSNRQAVDKRCYPDLQDMMDACRAEGLSPLICSSYRTQAYQETLYSNQVGALMKEGYTRAQAEAEAGTAVAIPGTSEHQLGLAVDIVDLNYQVLDRSQEETDVQKWLMEHCWEYGFILRYPEDKSEITGIIYEPWHYRYVGKEAAREITQTGLCLEEYLASP